MGKRKEENESYETLQLYYAKYLKDVRHLKDSSIKHYFDALNFISSYLKEKKLLHRNIYEVLELPQLYALKDILFRDEYFAAKNKKGNQMYSAGLNNYIRFAEGEFIHQDKENPVDVKQMDLPAAPVAPEDTIRDPASSYQITAKHWRRSSIIRDQALEFANFHCELHPDHQTFIAESTHHPYMEGHHLIPMAKQGEFTHSLDVYANIICLCPICHRRIHLGLKSDRVDMLKEIYERRGERLQHSGLILTENEFVELGMR